MGTLSLVPGKQKWLYLLPTKGKLMPFAFLFLVLLAIPGKSAAYSVLTHEALIDANWDKTILPALKQKYPSATEEDLKKARAFAYGGAVAPDMGYYPFGSKLFTNLVHYVRSGDFVQSLLDEQKSLTDYAFALGALCHYMADTYGHPLGTNRSAPIIYPEVGRKFGPVVTYAEDKTSHLRTEFGFDVLQTARGNYASQTYHNYIGFSVADTLLMTAFQKTYGLELKTVFPKLSLAIGTFRWSVKNLFPSITRAAWVMKKKDIRKSQPRAHSRDFIYRMHRKQYNHEFGSERERTGVFAHILSYFIRILPKVGPLKALKFKTPGPEAEKLFVQSFDTVLYHYTVFVTDRMPHSHHLPDIDFDTGKKTLFGEYPLCDDTYRSLLLKLKENDFASADERLKQNILAFYNQVPIRKAAEKEKEQEELSEALNALRGIVGMVK
ncbi:MAG TPA: zinc dependent phospholipase C family protein [Flavisolibacter sp.]|nr:zinc dependent phospholipase C family protein [Flavisolibacter sp.]